MNTRRNHLEDELFKSLPQITAPPMDQNGSKPLIHNAQHNGGNTFPGHSPPMQGNKMP
jgi:hypothetical protein